MFKNAFKKTLYYTRPLASGHLYYENRKIVNEINTLIILNENGDILTCSHIADLFLIGDETNEVFKPILQEIKDAKPKDIKKIEKKYNIQKETLIELHNIIIDIANNLGKIEIIKHPYLDLAIIKLKHNDGILIKKFPIFNCSRIEIGTSICNVGFAFPEYNSFEYDKENDCLKNNYKFMNFPIFPLDGIITRNIADSKNITTMFETSVPVLSGQAGGPIINTSGEILGIIIGNKKMIDKNITINLGIGINSQTITEFLKENNIDFEEIK